MLRTFPLRAVVTTALVAVAQFTLDGCANLPGQKNEPSGNDLKVFLNFTQYPVGHRIAP